MEEAEMKKVIPIVRAWVMVVCAAASWIVLTEQRGFAEGCVRYTFQRFGTGSGASCEDAYLAARSALYASTPSPAAQCAAWVQNSSPCGFEPITVDTECAWDGSQYTETVAQEYGCTTGIGGH